MYFAALSAGHSLDRLHRLGHSLQDGPSLVKKNPARFSEPHGFGAMVEERNAELILEVANLPAQRRLRNVQPRGSPSHILFLGDGHEVTKVSEFHMPEHTLLL